MAGRLKHIHWSWNSRLQDAAENRPALGTRDSGDAVKLLQEALEALGYPMPKSTRWVTPPGGFGPPKKEYDGVYGMETVTQVQFFQIDFGLKKDAAAGKDTLEGMEDQLNRRGLLLRKGSGGGGGGGGTTPPKPKKIQVWINTFLPSTIPGVTMPSKVPGDPNVITDSFPGKAVAIVTRTIHTNNRSFSATPPALMLGSHSLMTASATVEFLPGAPASVTFFSKLDIVFFYNNATHRFMVGARHTLTNSGSGLKVKSQGPGWVKLGVDLSINNPFGDPFPGHIDISGEVLIEAPGTINFDLKIDDFPAFEGYASDGTSKVTLFTEGVPPGKTPKSLLGGPSRVVKGVKTL